MGWTLGRYFFFRYAVITSWFFLGVFALIFLIDFTELSSRVGGLSGLHPVDLARHFGAASADDHAADGALRRRCSRRWRRWSRSTASMNW